MIALAGAGVKAIFPGDRVRASLKPLVLSAPHLVARLSELLLRFTEFALKALQLAFEATNLPLDSFDPVNLSVFAHQPLQALWQHRPLSLRSSHACGCAIFRSCSVSSF